MEKTLNVTKIVPNTRSRELNMLSNWKHTVYLAPTQRFFLWISLLLVHVFGHHSLTFRLFVPHLFLFADPCQPPPPALLMERKRRKDDGRSQTFLLKCVTFRRVLPSGSTKASAAKLWKFERNPADYLKQPPQNLDKVPASRVWKQWV